MNDVILVQTKWSAGHHTLNADNRLSFLLRVNPTINRVFEVDWAYSESILNPIYKLISFLEDYESNIGNSYDTSIVIIPVIIPENPCFYLTDKLYITNTVGYNFDNVSYCISPKLNLTIHAYFSMFEYLKMKGIRSLFVIDDMVDIPANQIFRQLMAGKLRDIFCEKTWMELILDNKSADSMIVNPETGPWPTAYHNRLLSYYIIDKFKQLNYI